VVVEIFPSFPVKGGPKFLHTLKVVISPQHTEYLGASNMQTIVGLDTFPPKVDCGGGPVDVVVINRQQDQIKGKDVNLW
jgi:hypothetical protein